MRWRADDLARKAALAAKALKPLDEAMIADLLRRCEEWAEIDGYGGGNADGGKVSGSKAALDGATAGAALARLCPRCQGKCHETDEHGTVRWCGDCNGSGKRIVVDPIRDALDDVFTRLVEVSGHARKIEEGRQFVLHAADRLREQTSGFSSCLGCHRNDVAGGQADPIRNRLCNRCRGAWDRYAETNGPFADPPGERERWEAERDRVEGHDPASCEACAELRRLRDRAPDWRDDRPVPQVGR